MSFIVHVNGDRRVSATLQGVSLADPDPGLTLVESGILVDGYPGTYTDRSFPVGVLAPITGANLTANPGDPLGGVFFNLGIRAEFDGSPLSVHGVWLDYQVNGTNYRALLPWLLTLCQTPVEGTCVGLRAQDFSFPPQ